MKHGSLFSGIGGFDLAAEWCGWENVFHCEWNPFGQKVLKHHFPKSISYNDITKTDFSIHRGNIDIITGGFPCQPYSTAGLRKGKADERHLFPEMLRAIKEIQPTWVIGENVRGLVSWGGGLVFHEVCNDLEREGYEVQPFLIPAAGINAPHKRERIWFIAYSHNARASQYMRTGQEWQEINKGQNGFAQPEFRENGFNGTFVNSHDKRTSSESGQVPKENGEIPEWNNNAKFSDTDFKPYASDTNGNRLERSVSSQLNRQFSSEKKHDEECISLRREGLRFQDFPTKPAICGGDDGLPRELDGITFPKWKQETIKAYGNAIVPQVAYEIFKTIIKFNQLNQIK
jgi:DNA (cytosine-5)-methyltransferase 1